MPNVKWDFLLRVIAKALLLFGGCNLLYAAVNPTNSLGSLSLYNGLLPGRVRLPYSENPRESYTVSLFNLNAMIASHEINQLKADGEYRVLLLGDSATWGWFLRADETYSAHINAADLRVNEGQRVVAYNFGYPVMSLTKDLLFLERARHFEPDLVIWLVSLESFPPDKQLFPPLLQNNPAAVRSLIESYDLDINPADPRFETPTFWQRTLIGQRRELANMLRLQLYGISWAATGIDQYIPDEIPQNQQDLDEDHAWGDYTEPVTLSADDLAFDVLAAGIHMADEVPIVIINEPMYISSGENSDIRYNALFPRWAYDAYRQLLAQQAAENDWLYLDWWDSIASEYFTDSPVHLSPAGAQLLSDMLQDVIVSTAGG